MEVLDLLLDSARRHVRHDEEDVREWARAAPVANDGAVLRGRMTAVADRMRATFAELVEVERMFQRAAHVGPTLERQLRDAIRRQMANAGVLLEVIVRFPATSRPSASVVADLRTLEFEAAELLDVMEGEADLREGKVHFWNAVRDQFARRTLETGSAPRRGANN
jgi:hypothetical protein